MMNSFIYFLSSCMKTDLKTFGRACSDCVDMEETSLHTCFLYIELPKKLQNSPYKQLKFTTQNLMVARWYFPQVCKIIISKLCLDFGNRPSTAFGCYVRPPGGVLREVLCLKGLKQERGGGRLHRSSYCQPRTASDLGARTRPERRESRLARAVWFRDAALSRGR